MREGVESGQATVLMLFMMVFTFAFALMIVEVGQVIDESAQARTAADAAALAGALEDRDSAEYFTSVNSGQIVSYHEQDLTSHSSGARLVAVTVQLGRATQTATAVSEVEWVRP